MKKTLLSFILFFAAFTLLAQTGYVKVANHGAIEKVIRVNAGGYLTTGYDSVWKVHVVKWDDNFNPVWKIKITDANFVGGHTYVVEANDGNFYFMGNSTEHSGCTYIVKISGTGTILWQKVYYVAGGALTSIALSAACGTDNGFLFGGGQCALSNQIVKCDANGAIEWQQQYLYPLSTGVITCWSIIPDVNGYTVSSGYNINSLLTFKIDAAGVVQSQSAYTYAGMQILPTRIVKLNNSGGYAILGNYNSSNNNKTEFVAVYNSALQLQSFHEFTVTYDQFILWDISAPNNGSNIFVNGSIYDNSVFYLAVMYLDNAGNIVWKKLGAGANSTLNKNVEFYGACLNGSALVNTGFGYNEGCVFGLLDQSGNGLCNELTFDVTDVPRTLALQSSTIYTVAATVVSADVTYVYDHIVATNKQAYCGNLGISDPTSDPDLTLRIHPNPASDELSVEMPGSGEVQISTIEGRLIKTIRCDDAILTLDISDLTSGFYVVNATTDKGIALSKFIKL